MALEASVLIVAVVDGASRRRLPCGYRSQSANLLRTDAETRIWRISGRGPSMRSRPASVTPRVPRRAVAADRNRGEAPARRLGSARASLSAARRRRARAWPGSSLDLDTCCQVALACSSCPASRSLMDAPALRRKLGHLLLEDALHLRSHLQLVALEHAGGQQRPQSVGHVDEPRRADPPSALLESGHDVIHRTVDRVRFA